MKKTITSFAAACLLFAGSSAFAQTDNTKPNGSVNTNYQNSNPQQSNTGTQRIQADSTRFDRGRPARQTTNDAIKENNRIDSLRNVPGYQNNLDNNGRVLYPNTNSDRNPALRDTLKRD